jgi:hypothetical protein
MTPLRWVGAALVLGMIAFAIQGGSFTTGDWLSLRREPGGAGGGGRTQE